MYQKTYYATHPDSIYGATNDDLRELYLVNEIFAENELRLNYSNFDRIAVGGAFPTSEKISLPVHEEPESAKGKPFLDRREMGAVNISNGKGKITVDGASFELGNKDCLIFRKNRRKFRLNPKMPQIRRSFICFRRSRTSVTKQN